ncbi:MAG TPA: TIM barrel protein [Clostridiales bacterium]|nr:TIM barrel protein [Clostridiales bacterium]
MDFTNKISIASYSFHKTLEEKMIDIYGYLESLRYRYHLNAADIWNGYIKDMDIEDFKKIRRAMDERGLFLANLCCDWCHPWEDDKDLLAQNNAFAEKMLVCAEILGARTVRIDLGVRTREITDEQFDYVAGRFQMYAKRAGDCGFKIGPENHWGASRRLSVLKKLFDAVNSPHFGILLHAGNWDLDGGETADENDRIAASMAFHTHISYQLSMRAEEVLPNIYEGGYRGVWGVEHHLEINEYQGVAAQLGRIMYALSKM